MELTEAKKLINKYLSYHAEFVTNAMTAQRYYIGDNDIKHRKPKKEIQDGNPNPLRNADNRIAFNFHQLLVTQKASYLFTAPPLFDVKDDRMNEVVSDTLGDAYAKRQRIYAWRRAIRGAAGYITGLIRKRICLNGPLFRQCRFIPSTAICWKKSLKLCLGRIKILTMTARNGIYASFGMKKNVPYLSSGAKYSSRIIFF